MGRLQRGTTALATRMEAAVRIRFHLPLAPGVGTAVFRGLHASSRGCHRLICQIQPPGRTQDWIKLKGKVKLTAETPMRITGAVNVAKLKAAVAHLADG